MSSSHYFIADLHLDPGRPAEYGMALEFFGSLHHASSLYILGDLFEYWVGDDAGIPFYKDVIAALAALGSAGCAVTVMLGNRDFLLGNTFADASGSRLVPEDELLIDLQGEPVLLMHGDTLCTDDKDYQQFRATIRNQQAQTAFLAKSIEERLAYAGQLRDQSRELSAEKATELMDVNAREVQSRMDFHACHTLIHGHTHRPADHVNLPGGKRRLVVGDWHATHAQYVVRDEEQLALKTWTI